MAKLYSTGRPSSLHPPAPPSPFLLRLLCSPDTALPPLSLTLLPPLHPHPHPHPHPSLQPFPVTQAIGHHHTDPIPETQSHKPTPRLLSPFSSPPPPFHFLPPITHPSFLSAPISHFPHPTSPPTPPRLLDSHHQHHHQLPSALSSPPLQNHGRMNFFGRPSVRFGMVGMGEGRFCVVERRGGTV